MDISKTKFLQRHLVLRFYHLNNFPGHILNEDINILEKLDGIIIKQKSPLGIKHTPINEILKEAFYTYFRPRLKFQLYWIIGRYYCSGDF